jgi:hypothetical protein
MGINLNIEKNGARRARRRRRKSGFCAYRQRLSNAGNEKSPSMTGFLFMILVKSPGFEFSDIGCH